MKPDRFKELLDELDSNSLQTLKEKNAKYAKNGDSLYNFKAGAEIMGCTPAQACWNYMTKHLAELRGKIEANDFSDREDFLEKCQDSINYFRFLWCIVNEEMERYTTAGIESNKKSGHEEGMYKFEFETLDKAVQFVTFMDEVKRLQTVIPKYSVLSYLGLEREYDEHRIGWRNTSDWTINETFSLSGPEVPSKAVVIMPPPVNI